MSKAFQAHLDAIAAGEVTKTNVIGLRKAVTTDAKERAGWRVSSTSLKDVSPRDLGAMLDALRDKRPRVTGGLHDSGVKQLQSRRYRKQLEAAADVIADIQSFHLIGFEMIGHRGVYATPVYEARDRKCRAFAFINVPWQSGGRGPEIVAGPYVI